MTRLLQICILALALFLTSRASAAFEVPRLTGFVVDPSQKLTSGERITLDRALDRYRQSSGHHVAVLVTDSLGGESIEDVAYRTFNTWKLGDARFDDGVLLVLAPTERRVRIEVGKGIEDRLTDLQAGHIVQEQIVPHMRKGAFYDAASAGTNAIEQAIGTKNPQPVVTKPVRVSETLYERLVMAFVVGTLFFFAAYGVRARGKALLTGLAIGSISFGTAYALAPDVSALAVSVIFGLLALFVLVLRGASGGGRGGGSSSGYDASSGSYGGSFTSYGGGGGDFSGGGGSSGGGGASGSY